MLQLTCNKPPPRRNCPKSTSHQPTHSQVSWKKELHQDSQLSYLDSLQTDFLEVTCSFHVNMPHWHLSALVPEHPPCTGVHTVFIQHIYAELLHWPPVDNQPLRRSQARTAASGSSSQTRRNMRWTPIQLVGGKGRRGAEQWREGGGCSRQKSTCQQTVQTRCSVAVTGYCSHMEDGSGGIEERLPQGGHT